jgi:hypothetical protein
MNDLIIFTHIPKTAGTSFVSTIIAPNFPEGAVHDCGSLKSCITAMRNQAAVITGHTPYGVHRFTSRKTTYITFFRDPIDRAVSYYHFVREGINETYKHPLYDYANSVSLAEFYENRLYQNHQTRYIAGYLADRLYAGAPALAPDSAILDRAMKNLKSQYVCFGLMEKFDASVDLFQKTFGWKNTVSVERKKKTHNRPPVNDLDNATLDVLRKAHELDQQLYDFAMKRFIALREETSAGLVMK